MSYIAPGPGQGASVHTLSLAPGSTPKVALSADGNPFRLGECHWVSNERLVCLTYAVLKDATLHLAPVDRLVAVNIDGTNLKLLSTRENFYSHGYQLGGGSVIDWLPDEDGAVLMSRVNLRDDHAGSRLGSDASGLGVDRIDTRTLETQHVVLPMREAVEYIADGRGAVRIAATRSVRGRGQDTGVTTYLYREPGAQNWRQLSTYDWVAHSGFEPVAVDRDRNVAYGFERKDGRDALFSVKLDGTLTKELVYSRPDVAVDELVRIGRRGRAVGASYATDRRRAEYFAPDIRQLVASLSTALPGQPLLRVVDASTDEGRMVVFAYSDSDPGAYYIFDRSSHELAAFLTVRGQLEGVKLAKMTPITYPATDGTMIPAYLTLPPGRESANGLPAIVLPHGGPSARDEWGFDWLAQFYAARGFAVLQPNFRGSSGYGDNWFEDHGFKSWEVAIGDVLDAGRWLVKQGIADARRMAIVGWSYGGYAALQSTVVDSSVFRAVVAIAPVTDLAAIKAERWGWSSYKLVSDFVGTGPHMHEGSPVEHVDRIKVPVLLFHGTLDRNIDFEDSQRMAARLTAAGGKCELVTFPGLDHHLEDSQARTAMLRKSDAFLRQALGM